MHGDAGRWSAHADDRNAVRHRTVRRTRDLVPLEQAAADSIMHWQLIECAECGTADILGASVVRLECISSDTECRKSLIEMLDRADVNPLRGVPKRPDLV